MSPTLTIAARRCVAASCLLLAGLTTTAMATPTRAKPLADATTYRILGQVLRAMGEGDLATLQRIEREDRDSTTRFWAVMAQERVHFNLAAATRDAETCERTLFDSDPAVALQCGQLHVGNLTLAGQLVQAREVEDALITRYAGHGVDKAVEQMRAYRQQQTGEPVTRVQAPSTDLILPYVDQGGPSDRPIVKATAGNGHDIDLLLDTGAQRLTLGQSQARLLGVTLTPGRQHTAAGMLSHDIQAQEGLLPQLTIGTIELHDLPVQVVPGDQAILGVQLLAALGAMRFGTKAMTVYGTDAPGPSCNSPMQIGGAGVWGGAFRILPTFSIDGTAHQVMLDTGMSMYLAGTQAAADQVQLLSRGKLSMQDLGGRHAAANVRKAKATITISGQPIEMIFPVYVDADLHWPIVLGAGALRDMDIVLDFRNGRMCFPLHAGLH